MNGFVTRLAIPTVECFDVSNGLPVRSSAVSFLVVPQKGQAGVVQGSLRHRKDGSQTDIAIPSSSPNGKFDWRVRLGRRQGRRSDGRTSGMGGQPFVLFHILPVVPRGLRSPLSSFPNCVFAFSRP